MTHTNRLKLPYIHSSQAQKEIIHNEAINLLDIFVQPVVHQFNVNSPPNDAQPGQLFVIGQNPQAEFANHASKLAVKMPHDWQYVEPLKWLEVTLDSDGSRYRFNGEAWLAYSNVVQSQQVNNSPQLPIPIQQAPTPSVSNQTSVTTQLANDVLINKDTGEYLKIVHLQEDINMREAYVDSQIQIPHHSIVIAVNIRVLQAVTGASSFNVGVEGATNRYGNNLSVGTDTTNIGLTDSPLTVWYNTPIRLTANNGNFTGGVVQVTMQLLKPHGPWKWD